MIVVVDSNIFFSALLSKNSLQLEILMKEDYKFVAPNFLFTEIFKYKEKILKYSKLNSDELLELLNNILSNIQFIPFNIVSSASIQQAFEFCNNVDEKDIPFVPLTIELNASLWTGDKRLVEDLSAKGFTQIFTPTT